MKLVALSYSEYENSPKSWSVKGVSLRDVNLIVGKNASGKTRILNVISALAKVISGRQTPLFISGTWEAKFSDARQPSRPPVSFSISFSNRQVVAEKLRIGKKTLVNRKYDGSGYIWAEGLKKKLHFRVPGDQLIIASRRDQLQHPFIEELHSWGLSLRVIHFGSDLGQREAAIFQRSDGTQTAAQRDDRGPHGVFKHAYEKFGDDFVRPLLDDLREIGYDCEEIGLSPLEVIEPALGVAPSVLRVKESDLACDTTQAEMSQGMYRVVAILSLVNSGVLMGNFQTILLDDVGEGLDFDRAKNLIGVLLEKAKNHSFQLIMTTNDRFIMNAVPLEHWSIVQRQGPVVSIINDRNRKREFSDFRYLGLNNFDFFAGHFYSKDQNDNE